LSKDVFIICAADLVQLQEYCDHFVMMYVCESLSTIKWKPDYNDLKHGIVVVLYTVLKPTDLGFRRLRVRVVVCGSKNMLECGRC